MTLQQTNRYINKGFFPLGGAAGALGKMTGAIGDVAAKLSFNTDFQQDRKKGSNTLGEGAEGAAKVNYTLRQDIQQLVRCKLAGVNFCLCSVFVVI